MPVKSGRRAQLCRELVTTEELDRLRVQAGSRPRHRDSTVMVQEQRWIVPSWALGDNMNARDKLPAGNFALRPSRMSVFQDRGPPPRIRAAVFRPCIRRFIPSDLAPGAREGRGA